jgi:mono/diheme cytochrome c family protein
MIKRVFVAAAIWICAVALAAGSARQTLRRDTPLAASAPQSVRRDAAPGLQSVAATDEDAALVKQYCMTCHNERAKTGGLVLDADLTKVGADAERWEKVVRKVKTGMMPPSGAPRPARERLDAFAAAVEVRLDAAGDAKASLDTPALHRLNRAEYANAIRDLLDLDVDVSPLLPADGSSEGFDNVAEALSVSPSLIQGYVSAAMKISRLAVGDRTMAPLQIVYQAPPGLAQDRHIEGLPLGTRGGMVVHHTFPLNAEYEFTIGGGGPGGAGAGGTDITVDGTPLTVQNTRRFRVPVTAGPHTIGVAVLDRQRGAGVDDAYSDFRSANNGFNTGGGVTTVAIMGPFNPTGTGETPSRRRIFTCQPTVPAGPARVAAERAGTRPTSSVGRVPPEGASGAKADPASASAAKADPPAPSSVGRVPPEGASAAKADPASASAAKADPAEEKCARSILSTLARRAYRGAVSAREIDTLLSFYKQGRSRGDFETGIQEALARVLVAPRFLYRTEEEPANLAPGAVFRISDLDLASRLSFFLWSSIPDEELLDLAAKNRLRDAATLQRQVKRMIADPKASAFVTNFAGQWLYLRDLANVQTEAPGFDDNLRQSFRRETELLFGTIVREDRSLVDLLDADFTFVDERLARHYGIPNVRGSHFRRVALEPGSPRRGLLGHGSMLTVTSTATRTSPVMRGKWNLENLLGAPPPQPPPGVETNLGEGEEIAKTTTLRQRLERHRASPVCASCHSIMDPLGFALENYDLIGAWRETDGPSKIDATGRMADGTPLSSPIDLRKAVLSRADAFVTTATEKLLVYALGRPVHYYDMPLVRSVVRRAGKDGNRFSAFLLGIIESDAFQKRVKKS